MISRGTGRAVVALVMLLLLLCTAACSDDDAPGPARTVTVTPTASATLAPTPAVSPSPTLPAAAQQPTRAGAEAFARYFFAVYNYAFWAADPQSVRALSDSGCVYCNSVISALSSMRAEGRRVEGGRVDVTTAVAAPGEPEQGLLVNLVVHQDSGTTMNAQGDVVGTTVERENGRIDLAVQWVNSRWILLDAHLFKGDAS